ncbi:hypothetical protein H257_14828 [Aphanomyces astaci]|uniref:Uncharacterized protein n=1 Tax=Aphanomyces astaci TaxID=112090 RepID=W4FS36_APHAT|nr:hypothetical protein H257_14828 [Aphanomyces astaci]ETV69458.1 hypothetical protein H257_14828 [Aphanomyces astaci]|eukprot:XP_009841031.1 hypothetical protein H257_14828 [Aphanomyces astaci]
MKLNENRGLTKDARDFELAGGLHAPLRRVWAADGHGGARQRQVRQVARGDQDPQGWKAPKVVAVVNVDKVPMLNFTKCVSLSA